MRSSADCPDAGVASSFPENKIWLLLQAFHQKSYWVGQRVVAKFPRNLVLGGNMLHVQHGSTDSIVALGKLSSKCSKQDFWQFSE